MKKIILLVFIVLLSLSLVSQLPNDKLHIIVCDVGQGDGILITKGYSQIVIDGGPNNDIVSCVDSHIPFWDRTIELVINTHADLDHYYGLRELFERYEIGDFLGSSVESEAKEYQTLKNEIKDKGVRETFAHSGQKIKINGITLDVLFPTSDYIETHSKTSRNDFSAIIYLKYGSFTGLFTGDTQPPPERKMIELGIVPQAYLLKVPHHGSKNGLIGEFLEKVNPKIAVISVGAKNKFGHPSPEVLDLLKEHNVWTFRTDKMGDVEITTDGTKVWANN